MSDPDLVLAALGRVEAAVGSIDTKLAAAVAPLAVTVDRMGDALDRQNAINQAWLDAVTRVGEWAGRVMGHALVWPLLYVLMVALVAQALGMPVGDLLQLAFSRLPSDGG